MRTGWIRELLTFSRKERIGIIVLLLIIFVLILIGKMIPWFIRDDPTNLSVWENEVSTYLTGTGNRNSGQKPLNLRVFDPNKVDSLGLVDMGLPLNLVTNWVRYLDRGGRFRNKADVKKIFGMTSQLFGQLDTFITIPVMSAATFKPPGENFKVKSPGRFKRDTIFQPNHTRKGKPGEITLELNSADSTNLLKIPGIGPVLASRIVRYRNLLGGFNNLSQLKEVYGLGEANIPTISACLTVDPSGLKTFNINFATIQELGRHPYIGYKTARKLVRLRDKKGRFLSPDDLSPVVTSDSLTRLIPYLKFSQ